MNKVTRQSHKTVSTNHNLFEEKGEPKRYRTEVLPPTMYHPNALSAHIKCIYKNSVLDCSQKCIGWFSEVCLRLHCGTCVFEVWSGLGTPRDCTLYTYSVHSVHYIHTLYIAALLLLLKTKAHEQTGHHTESE